MSVILHSDCVKYLFHFLDDKSLAKAEQACKQWFTCAESQWEIRAGKVLPRFSKQEGSTWRKFYIKYMSAPPCKIACHLGAIYTTYGDLIGRCETLNCGDQKTPFQITFTPTEHKAPITCFFLHHRSNLCRLVTGSYDTTLKVWRTVNPSNAFSLCCTLVGHLSPIREITGDASHLFSGAEDGQVRIWKFNPEEENTTCSHLQTLKAHLCAITAMQIDKKYRSERLFTGANNGEIKVWAKEEGKYKKVGEAKEGHGKKITALQVDHKEALLFSGSVDGTIRIWRYNRSQLYCVRVLNIESPITDLFFHQAIGHFYSSSKDGKIVKWESDRQGDPELPVWRKVVTLVSTPGMPVLSIRPNLAYHRDDFSELLALTPQGIDRITYLEQNNKPTMMKSVISLMSSEQHTEFEKIETTDDEF